jgi:hypothetical protein
VGPIGFRGFGGQETELHVNATPKIAKRKTPKGGSQALVRRTRVTKVERSGQASGKILKDHQSHQKGEILKTGKS